tara:strand:+ start:242 stop:499 length:258 start_codon:yes stop_codon:yes gene_type:complete
MDELEVFIIEMEIEFQEIMEDWGQSEKAKPDWWLIALGAKDAPRPVYDKSVDIYKRFKKFGFAVKAKDFETSVNLFTTAMLQGKI